MTEHNLYQVLGVAEDASTGQIKRAYRRLASLYHPDKVEHLGPRLKDLAEEELKKLNNAKTVLLDKDRRAEYDIELGLASELPDDYDRVPEEGWEDTPEDISYDDIKIEGGVDNFLICAACGFKNVWTDERCELCGVMLFDFLRTNFYLLEHLHDLQTKLATAEMSPSHFFSEMKGLERLYDRTITKARELSMEERMENLSEQLINKELESEEYFEMIDKLRQLWKK